MADHPAPNRFVAWRDAQVYLCDWFDRADPFQLSDPFSQAGRCQIYPQAWPQVEMAVLPSTRFFHPRFEDEMAHHHAQAHQLLAWMGDPHSMAAPAQTETASHPVQSGRIPRCVSDARREAYQSPAQCEIPVFWAAEYPNRPLPAAQMPVSLAERACLRHGHRHQNAAHRHDSQT
jgi:hypothetical protein